MKVVLCGPPHAGQFYLREGINLAIRRIADPSFPPMIRPNSPRGENPQVEGRGWHLASIRSPVSHDLDGGREWKTRPQGMHQPLDRPWIDLTIARPMEVMRGWKMQDATHAIVLSAEKERLVDWVELCLNLDLRVIALLYSDIQGFCDRITAETPILQGSIHRLGPGQDLSMRPLVQILASILVHLSQVRPTEAAPNLTQMCRRSKSNRHKTIY